MRRILILSILTSLCAVCQAQVNYDSYPNPDYARMIAEKPWMANLNACPYDLVVQPGPDTKAPRGYKPFYISHYGRHGTRSGWEQGHYDRIISTLSKAKEEGILSASGDSLLAETILVNDATNKMDGRLTYIGQEEHRDIAKRMYQRYRRVFRRTKGIRAISSEVPRCIVSMASFTNSLSRIDPKLSIVMDCGSEIQKEVTNDAPRSIRDARRHIEDSLKALVTPDPSIMMGKLFTDVEAAKAIVEDPARLERSIFSVGRISRSFGYDFDMYRFISFDAVYRWADYYNVHMYLGHCNSVEFGDERMKTTEPLVRHVIRMADDAIANGGTAADLRFGHDYPLMALTCYLGIEGVGERYTVEEAQKHYISTLHAPFAGNLQMIFYKSRKAGKPVLVKFLLNENEVLLKGLEPVQGPYYDWAEVREKISC